MPTVDEIAEPGTIDTSDPQQVRDAQQLARFGYKQQLRRRLHFFSDFGIAFTYLSPVVGIYSLFVLGLGTGGPAYLWLMPVVVAGQLLVALIFAELGSSYPIAGALFQWGKNLMGATYGWFVGWAYGWALLVTIAAIDTGVVLFAAPLINNLFGTNINSGDPNTILLFTFVALAIQTVFNLLGVRFTVWITNVGVWAEVIGTFGFAILLGFVGFHHGLDYLFTTQGVEVARSNPLGADFGGSWLLGAALIAILAHVYIFYGFESAGDIGEEVINASRTVPRAVIWSLLVGGITSFVLVAALILAVPNGSDAFAKAATFAGGVPYIINSNITVGAVQDFILLVVVYCFFSCGTAVQAAATRVVFSYARDGALPGARVLRKVSPRLKTPINAIAIATVVPAIFSLLTRFTPGQAIHILFVTYPAQVNSLLILVSFGVSGIYIAFQMVVLASLIARLRGWEPIGSFKLGAWALPVNIGALIWGVLIIINVLLPTGINSPRGALFNYDWMSLLVVIVLGVLGVLYYAIARPDRQVQKHVMKEAVPVTTR
jgi:amino acid transporter